LPGLGSRLGSTKSYWRFQLPVSGFREQVSDQSDPACVYYTMKRSQTVRPHARWWTMSFLSGFLGRTVSRKILNTALWLNARLSGRRERYLSPSLDRVPSGRDSITVLLLLILLPVLFVPWAFALLDNLRLPSSSAYTGPKVDVPTGSPSGISLSALKSSGVSSSSVQTFESASESAHATVIFAATEITNDTRFAGTLTRG
jgi:hypothetical protein